MTIFIYNAKIYLTNNVCVRVHVGSKPMKKALIYISIILGVVLFCFFALVVIMMLAPGVEVFGVKYVSAVVGKYENTINETITRKDIYINTGKVPVTVHFGDNSPLGVQFVQHFQGFSKTKNSASVKLTNKDGNEYNPATDSAVYITVTEYKKFIWARDNVEFYLNINLPAEYASFNSLTISSDSSAVKFVGRNQTINNLTFNSAGGLDIENNLTISNTLTVNTQRYLELGSNVTVSGDVIVNVTNENVKIANPVGKNITFTSGSGDLYINSCKDLTVTTGSGSIVNPTSGQISGNLDFTTTSGNVEIGSICGTESNIHGRTGFIKIDNCLNGNLTIETNRSTVILGNLKSANVTTTTGDITIASVTNNLIVKSTASGNITCGAVGGDATATTKNGDITFTGAVTGNLTINTPSGNTKMVSCNNLDFSSDSGFLKPNGTKIDVGGKATINNGSNEVIINSVGGNADIKSNSGSINITEIKGVLEKFESDRAPLNVRHVKKVENAKANYSHIYIGSAEEGVKITTSGNVVVGDLGSVGNAVINSGNGSIDLKNTTGKVDIGGNGHINFVNDSSTDIRINRTTNIRGDDVYGSNSGAGHGSVTAVNLKGSVRVYSANNVDLTFTGSVTLLRVNTDNSSNKVTINLNTPYNKIDYWLNSDKGRACRLFGDGQQIGETKSTIKSKDNTNQQEFKIVVFTTYAEVDLKMTAAQA